ncbi:phage major capsid protein [Leifsonia sp. ku-ls]|nr:phage major capsid protein [Leifsonia sp. ku-ls]
MDPKSELASLLAKNTAIVAETKATGRNLSEAEAAQMEQDAARIVELKGIISRGEAAAARVAPFAEPRDVDGFDAHEAGAKGYLTASGLKAAVRKSAEPGIKALVAGGSTVTPTTLSPSALQLGSFDSLGLLSLIPIKVRETAKYSYVRQSVRTNNAAVVAPGATKPTSVFTVASVDNALAVYAHLSEYVDKFLLEDNDDLVRFLEAELRDGVYRKVTADAIATIAGTSGVQTVVTSAGYTPAKGADAVYDAASKVSQLGFSPDLVILPVSVYDGIRTSKNTAGDYLGGNPFEGGARQGLWGFPTLVSPDIAAGTALVLSTDAVGISTDRQGVVTAWDAATGFDKNQLRARTEGRFATDVFQPAAVAKVTFTA